MPTSNISLAYLRFTAPIQSDAGKNAATLFTKETTLAKAHLGRVARATLTKPINKFAVI